MYKEIRPALQGAADYAYENDSDWIEVKHLLCSLMWSETPARIIESAFPGEGLSNTLLHLRHPVCRAQGPRLDPDVREVVACAKTLSAGRGDSVIRLCDLAYAVVVHPGAALLAGCSPNMPALEREFELALARKSDWGARLRRTAVHEAGHALVTAACGYPPSRVVAVSLDSLYAGWILSDDDHAFTRAETLLRVRIFLAGREAERLMCDGQVSAGAAGDLEKAVKMVESMFARWGLCEDFRLLASPDTADLAEKVNGVLGEQSAAAAAMLELNRDKLEDLTTELMRRGSLSRLEVRRITSGVVAVEARAGRKPGLNEVNLEGVGE